MLVRVVPLEIAIMFQEGEMKVQWTHLALHVKSLKASIEFYERYTNLRVADRHSDASSTGMEVVWLSEGDKEGGLGFVMVLQEGEPKAIPGAKPQLPLGPLSHLGFGLNSRADVDALAAKAKDSGVLKFGPTYLNPYAGYLCIISDPDGHNVEFSHGQSLGKPLTGEKSSATAY
jgi:catechol 2,3-dioxygenase-like lactoylglutathione lyase family enzyme